MKFSGHIPPSFVTRNFAENYNVKSFPGFIRPRGSRASFICLIVWIPAAPN